MAGFYVFISLFGLTSVLHLILCFMKKEKPRMITKCFCVLFLALSTLFLTDGLLRVLIFISCILGVIGDFFLLWPKNIKLKIPGTLFFAGEHVLNIIIISNLVSFEIKPYVYIIIGSLFILGSIVGLIILKGNVYGAGLGYFCLLIVMAVLSLILGINQGNFISFLPFIGYLLFLTSDIVLVLSFANIELKRHNFIVMITYLSAQALIMLGFCFI